MGVDVILDVFGETFLATTDSMGDYTFDAIPTGNAIVAVVDETLPMGYVQTTGSNPSMIIVLALPEITNAGADGYQPRGNLAGLVFEDAPGDPPVAGVTLSTVDTFSNMYVTVTDTMGRWGLTDIPSAGPVTVTLLVSTLPGGGIGWNQTLGDNPSIVPMSAGQTSVTLDGFEAPITTTTTEPPTAPPLSEEVPTRTVVLRIFNDVNGNGIQDTEGAKSTLPRGVSRQEWILKGQVRKGYVRITEFSIPGVTVTLLDSCGVLHTGVSDDNGEVTLDNVCEGSAVLTIIVPEGMELVTGPNPSTVVVPPGNGTFILFPPGSPGFGLAISSHLDTAQVVFVVIFSGMLGIVLISCCTLLGCIVYHRRQSQSILIRETTTTSSRGKNVRIIDILRTRRDPGLRSMQSAMADMARGDRQSIIRAHSSADTTPNVPTSGKKYK